MVRSSELKVEQCLNCDRESIECPREGGLFRLCIVREKEREKNHDFRERTGRNGQLC
jgi:hypothetical protein